MNTFVRLEVFREREERGETLLYTVRLRPEDRDWNNESETDDFLRYFTEEELSYHHQLDELLALLQIIARYGARATYFRDEQGAHALPRAARVSGEIVVGSGNPLRLYCIRWSERIVILLNGGVKTARSAQDCKNVRHFFRDAVRINRRLDQLFQDGDIQVIDDELCSVDGHRIEFKL